jgi:hypothetical protein
LFSALYRDLKRTRPWDHPIWATNSKLDARAFVEGLGLRVPELYAGPSELEEAQGWALPEACVVKPNDGAVAQGVLPLVHEGTAYRSLLGDGRRPWPAWCLWLAQVARRKPRTFPHPDNIRGPWLLEELVLTPERGLPYEWKFYVIGGTVRFCAQFQRDAQRPRATHRTRRCYRDRDMHPIPGGVKLDRGQDVLPGPRHPEALVAMAETIARALPAPFVRIDLYEDDAGPVFSEITPEPGGNHDAFRPEWDRRLGEAWMAAL